MSLKLRQELVGCEPIVRHKFSEKVSLPVVTGEESKTQQHFKDQCDLNKIAGNMETRGAVETALNLYPDLSKVDLFDLAGNMQRMKDIESYFSHLPVELRKQLKQDPKNLFDYLRDASKVDEHIKYGFRDKNPFEGMLEESGVKKHPGEYAPQGTKSGRLKKTTTVVEETSDE